MQRAAQKIIVLICCFLYSPLLTLNLTSFLQNPALPGSIPEAGSSCQAVSVILPISISQHLPSCLCSLHQWGLKQHPAQLSPAPWPDFPNAHWSQPHRPVSQVTLTSLSPAEQVQKLLQLIDAETTLSLPLFVPHWINSS